MNARRLLPLALALALIPFAADTAGAQSPKPAPTAAPSPSAAESTFLATIMRELPKRYPNPAAATKAGYVRYSNEDETGAISYVNAAAWDSTDINVPSQLWYDVNGRLLGADYSMKQADAPNGPSLFGIDPKRFRKGGAHVHYVTCTAAPGGAMVMGAPMKKCVYGKAVGAKRFTDAGGDLANPTAAMIVKTGAVTDASTIAAIVSFPAIYDTTVWVVPNPLGQWADPNPSVIPSPHAGKGEDDAM